MNEAIFSVNFSCNVKSFEKCPTRSLNFEIVNDVSGFNDLKMIQLIAEKAPKIILVHRHPNSSDIQEKMNYKDVVKEVRDHFCLLYTSPSPRDDR